MTEPVLTIADYMAQEFDEFLPLLLRASETTRRRLARFLAQGRVDVTNAILRIGLAGDLPKAEQEKRLADLLKIIGIGNGYLARVRRKTLRELRKDLKKVALVTRADAVKTFESAIGVKLATPPWSNSYVNGVLAGGRILTEKFSDHWDEMFSITQRNLEREVRRGLFSRESSMQIVRRVRTFWGTVERPGAPMRHLETAVRSAVMSTHNEARKRFYNQNKRYIKALRWNAAMEATTCVICGGYHGKLFTLDGEPIGHDLPYNGGAGNIHPKCRCSTIPVVKSLSEIPNAARAKLNPKAAWSGDLNDRRTFGQRMRDRPAAFQKEILGASRYRLWKEGHIKSLDQFLNPSGDLYTIDDLMRRYGLPDAA